MSMLPAATSVLAVDDEPLVLDVIASALEDGGYNVRSALSAREAVAILELDRARDLHSLVTDVNLRERTTGWDLAQRARALNPAIRVVYVTGDSEHEWASKGVAGSLIVIKPFTPEQVVVALASLADELLGGPASPA